MHGYCLHNLPAKYVKNIIVSFYIHAILHYIDAIVKVINHVVFVQNILLIEMYAEISLPELPAEAHQPVHTWQYC